MTIKEVIYQITGRDYLSPLLDKLGVYGDNANRVMRNLRTQTMGMSADMREAAREIPGMGRALSMVKNPLIMGGALIAGVGAVMVDATNRAKAFNTEFRNLANINLSRSIGELSRLKTMIANTAYAGGHDISATSRAYFDVQSITGMYGSQASPMVRKGMEFARLMGADPNEWVAGLAKAQANYGFSNADIDKYQASAYASLVAGAMTFDQLAKASPVFAGSAAASGQSFTDAMKMFTLFTMRTKSTDEAATMTNSLFRDLTREGTVKGFLNAGINPYTSEGSFKSIVQLMTELADVFASQQTQQQVNNLKNAFSGSEGLTAMLNAAAGGAEQLSSQLSNFESAELKLAEARSIARNDATLLEEELRNRLNIQIVQLGNALLPLRVRIVEILSSVTDYMGRIFGGSAVVGAIGARQENLAFADAYNNFVDLSPERQEQLRANLLGNRAAYEERIAKSQKALDRWGKWHPFYSYHYNEVYGLQGRISAIDQMEAEMFGSTMNGGLETTTASGGKGKAGADASAAVAAAIGGGRQQKVINVTIGSLVGSQSFNSTVRESRDDITSIVEEALIRAIYGAEQLAVR